MLVYQRVSETINQLRCLGKHGRHVAESAHWDLSSGYIPSSLGGTRIALAWYDETEAAGNVWNSQIQHLWLWILGDFKTFVLDKSIPEKNRVTIWLWHVMYLCIYIYIYYLYSIIYICGSSTVSLKQRLEMARRCPWSPRAFPLLDAAAATASGSGSAAEAGGGRGAAVEVGGACGHGSIMDPSWPVDAVYPPTFTLQHDRNMSFTTFTITLTYLTWYAIA